MPDQMQAAREAAELGFRAVPWHITPDQQHNLGRGYGGLPRDTTDGEWRPGRRCPAGYRGWVCTQRQGHEGSHRAGDECRIVAEWHSSGCPLHRTNREAREEERQGA